MLRRLSSLASACSLLICIGAAVLWARSWGKFDVLTYHRYRVYQAVSEDGRLRLQRLSGVVRRQLVTMRPVLGTRTFVTVSLRDIGEQPLGYDDSRFTQLNRYFGMDKPWTIRNRRTTLPRSIWPRWDAVSFMTASEADFTLIQHQRQEWVVGHALQLPYWMLVALATVLPIRYALGVWRCGTLRRRCTRRGACQQCSYDLTGNTSGVCPECGVPTPEKATA